mmetsp:Transcript_22369/g.21549  ORF Transcript_22369/g.21549 Transcript_22369/m.21549 type:complete len:95 (-) Transcript_22369:23-307(-)
MVSTISEQEFQALNSLLDLFSRKLPQKGGLTPLHYHINPKVPFGELNLSYQRSNRNAIDKRTLQDFYFMSYYLQCSIAKQIGCNLQTLLNYFGQ